jgi:molybdopterin-guanine dinucleotide biosynthesis protein A
MGTDKAFLPFGDETMLQRVARIVGTVVDPSKMVVVAAANQSLPALPNEIQVVHDSKEFQGPLAAIASGLATLSMVDAVFITGCDTPLLAPMLIEFLFRQLGESDAVLPQDEYLHPLCAVYRTSALTAILRHATAEDRSLHRAISSLNATRVPTVQLREVDRQLNSLLNVNNQEDYVAALKAVGIG